MCHLNAAPFSTLSRARTCSPIPFATFCSQHTRDWMDSGLNVESRALCLCSWSLERVTRSRKSSQRAAGRYLVKKSMMAGRPLTNSVRFRHSESAAAWHRQPSDTGSAFRTTLCWACAGRNGARCYLRHVHTIEARLQCTPMQSFQASASEQDCAERRSGDVHSTSNNVCATSAGKQFSVLHSMLHSHTCEFQPFSAIFTFCAQEFGHSSSETI